MGERIVRVLYCDDIRLEVGNKHSYMGVFSGEMLIPTFPVTLPKLCVSVEVTTPCSMPFKKLRIVVYKGDEVLAETELPEDALKGQEEFVIKDADDENQMIGIATMFSFSPVVLEKETNIRVRAFTENEELKGAALKVRAPSNDIEAKNFMPLA